MTTNDGTHPGASKMRHETEQMNGAQTESPGTRQGMTEPAPGRGKGLSTAGVFLSDAAIVAMGTQP